MTAPERAARRPGRGWPIVFLHGYPLNHGMWEPQFAALSERNQGFLLDLPGFGRARDQPVPDTFKGFVAEVGRRVEAILPSPAVIVGHSFGGYLALGLYQARPDLFAALVLADTRSDPDTPAAKQQRLGTALRLENPGERLDTDEVVRGLLAPGTWKAGGGVVARVREMVEEAPTPSVIASLRAIADRPDLGPVLSTIRRPTLVLWGTEDQLIPPAQSEGLVHRIAGSRGVPIEGAGHLPSLEAPGECTEAIRSLLAELRVSAPPGVPTP
jgi:pimeloyl-ACP methyl ester carboxylesterase